MRPDRVQIEPAGVTLCGCTSRSQRSDPDTAHPGDDPGRGDDAHRDAYHPKAIGVASIAAVRLQHHSPHRRAGAQYKKDAEPVVPTETDVSRYHTEPGLPHERKN